MWAWARMMKMAMKSIWIYIYIFLFNLLLMNHEHRESGLCRRSEAQNMCESRWVHYKMTIVIVQRIIFFINANNFPFVMATAIPARIVWVPVLFDVTGSMNGMKYARKKNWIRIIKMRNVWRERLCWLNSELSGNTWRYAVEGRSQSARLL